MERLFESENLVIKVRAQSDKSRWVVTFDNYGIGHGFERLGFGEAFFADNGVSALHVMGRREDWYQYPEIKQALAAVREQANEVVDSGPEDFQARIEELRGQAISRLREIDPEAETSRLTSARVMNVSAQRDIVQRYEGEGEPLAVVLARLRSNPQEPVRIDEEPAIVRV